MRRIEVIDAHSIEEAAGLLRKHGDAARPLAGGGDLLSLLRPGPPGSNGDGPHVLVNLAAIPGLSDIHYAPGKGHVLGPMATLADLEADRSLRQKHRGIAQAAAEAGSVESRSVATLGGNLCQRPRCAYFQQHDPACLKRGGAGCPALEGDHRYYHAILEGGVCVMAHPSDLAPALIAAGATAHLAGGTAPRSVPLEGFFVGPRQDVTRETALAPGELLAEVRVPEPAPGTRSVYLKARMGPGHDFALAAAAVSLRVRSGAVADVRVVLGGVAPRPHRALGAERLLRGGPVSPALAQAAADTALAAAEPLHQNAYKVDLARSLVKRAILQAAEGHVVSSAEAPAPKAPPGTCHTPSGAARCRACNCAPPRRR
jgi:xanthine dehydrogenase YagS FAD-binding subunit